MKDLINNIKRKDLPNLWKEPNKGRIFKESFEKYDKQLSIKKGKFTKSDWEFISKMYNKIGEMHISIIYKIRIKLIGEVLFLHQI